jgi:hypothetical protein
MSRQSDLVKVFNFMIELLKEEDKEMVQETPKEKELITENPSTNTYKLDFGRAKEIMGKIDEKDKLEAIIKEAQKKQEKTYTKEIKELKEAFLNKVFETKKEETLENEPQKVKDNSILSNFIKEIDIFKGDSDTVSREE